MYQPQLRDDQIESIYKLKEETKRPMTKILQEAVDFYLNSKSSLEYIKKQLEYGMQDVVHCPKCCNDKKLNYVTDLEHADYHAKNAREELEKLL